LTRVPPRQGFRCNVDETGASKRGDDSVPVVVTVRRSRQKARGIAGEHVGDGCGDEVCELIVRERVPDVEDEVATRLQDAPCFAVGLLFVGKKHHPELTDHGIKCFIGKQQRLRIDLLPAHAA